MKILLFAFAAASFSGTALAQPAAPKDYPACSKTVTDSCIQKPVSRVATHHKGKVVHRKAKTAPAQPQ